MITPAKIPWRDFAPDPEVMRWRDRLVEIVGKAVWAKRRGGIEKFIEGVFRYDKGDDLAGKSHIPDDNAAWHLFLCETYTRDLSKYDMAQGARVIPVVKALMRVGDRLFSVPGAEERIRNTFINQPSQFDDTLFELLVAAVYIRNGWRKVEFLPESRSEKRPDLRVESGKRELFVECKRKSRVSQYSSDERRKWLRLFQPVQKFLVATRLSVFLEIRFRAPLLPLDDGYLFSRLRGVLPLAVPGVLIDDRELRVEVRYVDLSRVRTELIKHSVRRDTRRLPYLLFGFNEPWRGITYSCESTLRPGFERAVDEVNWAAGAAWSCEAEESISRKARYLKRELAKAVRQLPGGFPGVVHWGIELYDGEQVAKEILVRTISALKGFDPGTKDLCLVYCHILVFDVPPESNWTVDETCHHFGRGYGSLGYLLRDPRLLAQEEETEG